MEDENRQISFGCSGHDLVGDVKKMKEGLALAPAFAHPCNEERRGGFY